MEEEELDYIEKSVEYLRGRKHELEEVIDTLHDELSIADYKQLACDHLQMCEDLYIAMQHIKEQRDIIKTLSDTLKELGYDDKYKK